MSNSIILSSNYLPPVSYFHAIAKNEGNIVLDKFEHFPKQTYRNRAKIATANGVLDLIVPIQHGRKERIAIKDIKINYDHDWQRLHWLSIQTAYRSSPYFEFYEDDFKPFYEVKYDYLFDFNLAQFELILKCLKLKRIINYTSSYEKEYDALDFRNLIHPKKDSILISPKPYYQIFEERHGFIADLSIVDLIFNQGPQSKNYLL